MELRVSSPCPMSWEDLVGNDRIRYCGKCRLNVYNLADMEPPEVEALVRRTEGRLCGRLYLRGDRTASLRDCPGAARQRWLRRLIGAASVLVLAVFATIFRNLERPDPGSLPPWLQKAVALIDPEPVPPRPAGKPPFRVLLGGICPVTPPVPSAAPPTPTPGN
ncbi:MAG TPA: hypothetical protein VMU54_09820 [Planctomycetota bacterium]|nr:hypothetical protein [Planctomycetota bacterium]